MKRKVRKKPEQEPEKEPVVIMVDKEKAVENEKEKMSPVEKERQGMKTEEPGEAMTPLKK
ncbi:MULTISPECIES: hypothetical protein [Algoriphagus]|jgi:hypothetical protein|uniref:Uncharacterized protein n=1 Tax=Algoriphagus zhangzhouensis TaxID=1073327 RepID=A0A1M7ZBK9_9BACT|nr:MULTISPECIES: hypothetical protein [Algoriphagus]TDY46809.1 hypothetical protein A8938_1258 [Algoriphagus zhangzhouensis]SHO62232.1 hypothetical protein SAMN04488108_2004 [Algoriphagus zhangzhouensis]